MESRLVPTDCPNPNTGEPLYVEMRKPSLVRWLWLATCLYCGIVFRRYEFGRFGPLLAWQVVSVVYGRAAWRNYRAAWRRGREPEGQK